MSMQDEIVEKSRSVSDKDGHYDLDGVSLACGHVIVGSTGEQIECGDPRFFEWRTEEPKNPKLQKNS